MFLKKVKIKSETEESITKQNQKIATIRKRWDAILEKTFVDFLKYFAIHLLQICIYNK